MMDQMHRMQKLDGCILCRTVLCGQIPTVLGQAQDDEECESKSF